MSSHPTIHKTAARARLDARGVAKSLAAIAAGAGRTAPWDSLLCKLDVVAKQVRQWERRQAAEAAAGAGPEAVFPSALAPPGGAPPEAAAVAPQELLRTRPAEPEAERATTALAAESRDRGGSAVRAAAFNGLLQETSAAIDQTVAAWKRGG